MKRKHPKVVVKGSTPHKSARTNVPLNLIVLHSTESHNRPGKSDLEGVASWFANPASQASCHVITDSDGTSARIVEDKDKAWHCASYNSAALGIEQIGFAAQGKEAWRKDGRELDETARWIARWSLKHGIPIQRAKVSNGFVVTPGVATHKQLGTLGGNHHDPGDYPFDDVLKRARKFKHQLKGTP